MRDNNPIEVSGLPAGLTYANNRITGTPTGAPGNSTVTIKAYDKNGNMAQKQSQLQYEAKQILTIQQEQD